MDLDARALLAGMTDLRFSLEVTSESNEQNDQDNKMDLVLNLISKVFFTLVGILFYTSAGEGPTDFCPGIRASPEFKLILIDLFTTNRSIIFSSSFVHLIFNI